MTALNQVLNKCLALFAPPPKLNAAQWADKYHVIPHGNSAEPGKYSVNRLPYHKEPLESFTDPTASETVLLFARQIGKTELLLCLIGYVMDWVACNVFVKYPTRDKAKDFSQKKLAPMIKANNRLRKKVRPHRSRDSGNTLFGKLFPGGSITLVGANSSAALRGTSNRVVIQDEIDADEPNQEGDPVPQADATASNFHDAIKVKSSTPTIEPEDDGKGGQTGSRIQILFNESDQRYWNCACPKCGAWQVLRWSQVKWTWKQPDGTEVSDPELACYECESCHAELSDTDRVRMIMGGRWIAKNPRSRIRGYHLSGLYRIMGKKRAYKSYLHEFVENFLKAKKDGSLEVWTNTFLAECWKQSLAKLETDPIMNRAENYGPSLPKRVLCLTQTIDVQGDRWERTVWGWGLGHELWGIRRDVAYGDPHKPQDWQAVDDWVNEKFEHPILGQLSIPVTCIDSGGQSNDQGFADPVYRFVRPRQPMESGPGVYATKGSSNVNAPLLANRRPKKGVCLKMIGTSLAKVTLHARLKLAGDGPRCVHFPKGFGFTPEFYEQLGAEAPRRVKKRGFTFTEWVKIRARNEGLDLMVLALASIEILNPDLQAIAEKVRAKEPEALPERKVVVGDAKARPAGPRKFKLSRPVFRRNWKI